MGSQELGPVQAANSQRQQLTPLAVDDLDSRYLREKYLAEWIQLQKLGRFICLAHLHRRHIERDTDITGSDQGFERILVAGRTP